MTLLALAITTVYVMLVAWAAPSIYRWGRASVVLAEWRRQVVAAQLVALGVVDPPPARQPLDRAAGHGHNHVEQKARRRHAATRRRLAHKARHR
ncbi:MAG: hypothetical protein Q7V57_11195 [Actinomycetota bacterium]|nr:hypothetical protein [Actinomycetota bacterium]